MAECGLLDIGCLPELFFGYIAHILNLTIQPLLNLTKGLLSANVNLSLFFSLWIIMVYVLSMFYAILIIYSGFQFITSGYDAHKREKAKEWLKNVVIMIILVQSSFFLYELMIQISSVMTSTMLSLIDGNFFLITVDNIPNVGLELVFYSLYIFMLLFTSLFLIVRYGIVAMGVVLFPISIFLYFIEPLKSYGLFILNFLGVAVFVTFFDAIILVVFSELVKIGLFANIKILIMISAFWMMDIFMFLFMFLSLIKAGLSAGTKVYSIASKFA